MHITPDPYSRSKSVDSLSTFSPSKPPKDSEFSEFLITQSSQSKTPKKTLILP